MISALIVNPPARGNRVAIVPGSGGAGGLAADALSSAGLDVAELSAATQAAIGAFIPSYGSTRNPVDLTAGGSHGGGMLRAAEILCRDDGVDMLALVTTLAYTNRVTLDGAALKSLLARCGKPILFHSYTLASPLGLKTLAEAGAIVQPSMRLLAAAARALADAQPVPPPPDTLPLPPALAARLAAGDGPVSEHGAKALLAEWGVPIAASRLVTEAAGLDPAAATLGFPLALKIQSPDIAHKTEAGGVRLGIADGAALHAAFAEVVAAAARHAPGARIEGVLLERMAAPGTEIIIGVLRDPTLGPVVMVGAGGTMAEQFCDTAHRLAPVDEAEAAAMLEELRSAPVLKGFRGAAPGDVPALARLVAQISQLAAAGREHVAELELNPVIVHAQGQGCTIADALLVLKPAGQHGA